MLQGLSEFREHLGGRLTIMLLTDIGRPLEVHELEHDLIKQAIAFLERRAAGETRRSAAAALSAGQVFRT